MAARAMNNFGLSKLSIVNPRDGWPSKKAESSAKHADKIINRAKVYESLEDAVFNYDLVIATSNRKRFLTKKTYDSFNILKKKIRDFRNTAILFGPENSGLSNQDIRLANFLFTIPTYNTNKSLNLSHAVCAMSYELFQANNTSFKNTSTSNIDRVSKLEFSNFINVLVEDLNSRGFFKPIEKKANMIDNIYSIYNKTDLSKKELRMLWGIHKKLKNQPKSLNNGFDINKLISIYPNN